MTIERASDNPFPSILMVEGDPEALAANPVAGQQRLAVDDGDHALYLVDDAGVKTLVGPAAGTGLTDPMTTRGDIIVRDSSNATARLAIGSAGKVFKSDGTDPSWQTLVDSIQFVIDGGGSAITTGVKGYIEVPFACTIVQATLLADQSGSIVVNVWKDTYANYPPVVGDKITASAPPTISTATKSQDSTLTGWTTSIAAGDVLAFNVDSITTCTRVTISLKVNRL